MNASEAAILLAKIAAFDNREPTEAAARAWAEALPDVALADALEFVPKFFRRATCDRRSWLQPGDVLVGVRALFTERRAAFVENAKRVAIEGLDPDSDDVRDAGGLSMIVTRAQYTARNEFNETNPMPGPEIDEAARKKDEERLFEQQFGRIATS